jgi:Uma2 family endonuclease
MGMNTATAKQIYTYQDIDHLPDGNYEIIDGERHDMTPTGFGHGRLEGIFFSLLTKHYGDKGFVAVGEVGIIISRSPLRIRAADVVYIGKQKTSRQPEGLLEIPPDLIIEIISEINTAWAMTDKVREYLAFGVERVVLVDPITQSGSLYRKGKKEALLFSFDEEVALIEGLTVRIKDLLA